MWDITYPVLVMEDTQVIVINMQIFPPWALWRLKRMDSGVSSASCLQSFMSLVGTEQVHSPGQGTWLAKWLLLSEDQQLKFGALGSISFILIFSPPSLFLLLFMKRCFIMWFDSVFEMKAVGVPELKQNAGTCSPPGSLSAWDDSAQAPAMTRKEHVRFWSSFASPPLHFLVERV